MALNPDKSDAILFGTLQRSHSYANVKAVDVAGAAVNLERHVKIVGVTLDSQLTMNDHVKAVTKSAFYHIRSLRHIRSAITEDMAKTVASALVSTRLDYANAVLYGMSKENFNRLQRIQNVLARVVVDKTSVRPGASSTEILRQLHWLPIESRVKYKLASLTYKVQTYGSPTYLAELINCYVPVRPLRSSGANLLTVPRFNLSFGSRSFRVSAPTIWNSLPHNVRASSSLTLFRRNLKTFLFESAFSAP
jgi:hypothetical protein